MISGSGCLTKTGAGVFYLYGANTYTGTTNVNAGSLVAANNTALGTNGGGTVVANGASLVLQNNVTVTGEALSITGTGNGGFGALQSSGASGPGNATNSWAVVGAPPTPVRR